MVKNWMEVKEKGDIGLEHTMALIPPEDTNEAVAWLDCITAPSKSGGKQLKNNKQISNKYY